MQTYKQKKLNEKKKIAIFTGGRQDYYLLKPLILELLKKPVKAGFFSGHSFVK